METDFFLLTKFFPPTIGIFLTFSREEKFLATRFRRRERCLRERFLIIKTENGRRIWEWFNERILLIMKKSCKNVKKEREAVERIKNAVGGVVKEFEG